MERDKYRYFFIVVLLIGWFVRGETGAFALSSQDIYKKACPGVVFIIASDNSKTGTGGAGSIIRDDGLIITNAHILINKDSVRLLPNISVFLKPDKITGNPKTDLGKRYRGKVLEYNVQLDLALVMIQDAEVPLPTVDFADSGTVITGDHVYVIGHPEQGGLWSLTTGVISAFMQNYGGVEGKDLFQTDAGINRGNSGGPLLNEEGNMIGINSLIARTAEDGMTITDVNFSIKSNVAADWLHGLGYKFGITQQPFTVSAKEIEKSKEKPVDIQTPLSKVLPQTVKTHSRPVKEEQVSAEPGSSGENNKEGIPGKPKILTEKNPYNMDELITAMQEMEDLMEEMRGKINKIKNRR